MGLTRIFETGEMQAIMSVISLKIIFEYIHLFNMEGSYYNENNAFILWSFFICLK